MIGFLKIYNYQLFEVVLVFILDGGYNILNL